MNERAVVVSIGEPNISATAVVQASVPAPESTRHCNVWSPTVAVTTIGATNGVENRGMVGVRVRDARARARRMWRRSAGVGVSCGCDVVVARGEGCGVEVPAGAVASSGGGCGVSWMGERGGGRV